MARRSARSDARDAFDWSQRIESTSRAVPRRWRAVRYDTRIGYQDGLDGTDLPLCQDVFIDHGTAR